MRIDREFEITIENAIRERLSNGIDAIISIEKISVCETTSEITIQVKIETSAKPEDIAERYFGLTRKVREALGDRWRDFFPIITPNIEQRVHA